MNYSFIYIALGLILGYILFKKFLVSNINVKALMTKGAIIIDVRTPQEYDNGHIAESMNIPLNVISTRIDSLRAKNVPIICVCASGMRSGNACATLKNAGIECYNGGNWSSLNNKLK
jgi:phage shock protein E